MERRQGQYLLLEQETKAILNVLFADIAENSNFATMHVEKEEVRSVLDEIRQALAQTWGLDPETTRWNDILQIEKKFHRKGDQGRSLHARTPVPEKHTCIVRFSKKERQEK